jgi:hypothetical protein
LPIFSVKENRNLIMKYFFRFLRKIHSNFRANYFFKTFPRSFWGKKFPPKFPNSKCFLNFRQQ